MAKKGTPKNPQTVEQIEAFETYYRMGEKRSIRELSNITKRKPKTLQNWMTKFKWSEVIQERINNISEIMAEKTDADIVAQRMEYRVVVRDYLSFIKKAVNTVIEIDKKTGVMILKIQPENIRDVTALLKAAETLIRLDMELLGGEVKKEDEGVKITFVQYAPQGDSTAAIKEIGLDSKFEEAEDVTFTGGN